MKAKWTVLAVYENGATRPAVVQYCDTLVQRFWSEFSFDLSWCDWAGLKDSESGQEAERKAHAADLIIIATSPRGTIPLRVKSWIELALRERAEREGMLVGLPAPESGVSAEAAATQAYLRKLAHAAGMDYLTTVPQSLPHGEPESVESFNQRATQVTSVLDKILQSRLPPRVG